MTRRRRYGVRGALALVVGVLAILAAGCGGDDDGGAAQIEGLGTTLEEIQANAKEEGQVNIVQWAGYATARRRVHGGDRLQGEHEGRR